jgi:hypothetical protein
MIHYQLQTPPRLEGAAVSADLCALLAVIPQLTITLVQRETMDEPPRPPVVVLSVPEAAQPAISQRLGPRWYAPDQPTLRQIAGVAERPEWRQTALLIPKPWRSGPVDSLVSVVAGHWMTFRLDLYATAQGRAALIRSPDGPGPDGRGMLYASGWLLLPLTGLPARCCSWLVRLALTLGGAAQVPLTLHPPSAVLVLEEEDADPWADAPLPPTPTPAAQLLAEAWQAGQQEPPPRTPIAGVGGDADGASAGGTAANASSVGQHAEAQEEEPSWWPVGPGRLTARLLEAVIQRVLDDPDVQARGVTKNKLKAAGAGADAEALLAWLDAAGVLAASADTGVQRWRAPRPLQQTDLSAIAEQLRATELPDEAQIEGVRSAFSAIVPLGGAV